MGIYFAKTGGRPGWRFTPLPAIFIEKDDDYEQLVISIEWLCWSLNFEFDLWKTLSNH